MNTLPTTLADLRELARLEIGLTHGQLHEDKSFTDFGMDSLMLVDFLFAVEDRFHVEVPYRRALKAATLVNLAHLIQRLQAEKALALEQAEAKARAARGPAAV